MHNCIVSQTTSSCKWIFLQMRNITIVEAVMWEVLKYNFLKLFLKTICSLAINNWSDAFWLQNLTARRCFEYSYVSKNKHREAYGHMVCAASCCQWLELFFLSLETGLWIMGPLSILAQTGPLAFSQPPALSQVLMRSSRKQVTFK